MNIIFNFFSNLLYCIFNFTGDLGLAIVLLTAVVRIVLLPLSLKQKRSILNQQRMAAKIQKIKENYKSNKQKINEEIKRQSGENAKNMLGCLVNLIQLPVLMTLWRVIVKIPVNGATFLIPWVASIKLSDSFYIIPVLYMLVSLAPSLLSYVTFLKAEGQAAVSKSSMLIMALISFLIARAAPVAVGIYLITASVFSFLEELIFRIYLIRDGS